MKRELTALGTRGEALFVFPLAEACLVNHMYCRGWAVARWVGVGVEAGVRRTGWEGRKERWRK